MALAVALVSLVGCSDTPAGQEAQRQTAPTSTGSALASASPTSASVDGTEPTPAGVLSALKAAGLPITLVKEYTENDDPNKLLGRPGGYVRKNAFSDSRLSPDAGTETDALERGGSVEVYPDAAGARKRADYIESIGQPLANEYDYVNGQVLVRVTGELPPSQAKEYDTALQALQLQ